jgi:hypothetical protein
MTFEKVTTLPPNYATMLRLWCEGVRPMMRDTNSRFAPGRKTIWLINEVHLRTGEVTPAWAPEWMYQAANYLLPGCGAVQLSYGAPIAPHRDHAAFNPLAVGVNLGSATFLYEQHAESGKLVEIPLSDGDVYRFDSKRLHGSKDLSEGRYSINLWTLVLDRDHPRKDRQ